MSIPVNALTRLRSVIAKIMWFTPAGAISLRIFAAHSAGEPDTDSRSASSGDVSSTPLARSPPPMASMIGFSSAASTPLRGELLGGHRRGVDADHRPCPRSFAFAASGPVANTPHAEVERIGVLAGSPRAMRMCSTAKS